MRLLLPDQEIKLLRFNNHGEEYRTWDGSSSDDIAAMVGQHAEPEKLQDWASHGPPRNLLELNARELCGICEHFATPKTRTFGA